MSGKRGRGRGSFTGKRRLAAILGVAACILMAPAGTDRGALAQPAAPAGDPAAGLHAFFTWCAQCHYAERGAPSIIAPNLFGVVGRRAGEDEDYFNYSDQLLSSDVTWTEQMLDTWLAAPAQMIPGTRMEFPGLGDPDRANVIAYLKQNK